MELVKLLEVILGYLCLLGVVAVIIFFLRKRNDNNDVTKWIEDANKQMEEDLKKLEIGNKTIDDLEKKILICKKKLNMKLFDK